MSLREWVGVYIYFFFFLQGRPQHQMDTVMSKEMIWGARGERRDKRREREQCQENYSPEKRRRGSCIGRCALLSINRISNKELVLKGSMVNYQAWLPNSLTENISKAYRSKHAINTRQSIPQWAAVSKVELKLLRRKPLLHCDYLRRQSSNTSLGLVFIFQE